MIGHKVVCRFILAIIVALLFSGELATANVIDDLNQTEGWEVLVPDPSYGKVEFSNGMIAILRHPSTKMETVAVKKTYQVPFLDNTWIHALIRQPQGAWLGADVYTDIRLNNDLIAEFDVNGEEHWFNNNGRCTAKNLDDSYHIGLAADNREYLTNEKSNFYWTNDVPVSYPPHVQIPYSKWTLYSVKYHVPEDGVPRWHFFVEGSEIVYRDIGHFAPEGQFQNVATVKPHDGNNAVSFTLSILGDGDTYKKEKGYPGAEQRQCFSDVSPFWVDTNQAVHVDTARAEWDLLMVGNGTSGDFDLNTIKALIYAGRVSASTAIVTDMISWQEAQFTCPYVSHDEIRRVHTRKPMQTEAFNFCLERVKNDIYAGYIGTVDAVLTDLISWENAQFNCPFMSEEEQSRVRASPKGSPMFCTKTK